MPIQRYSIFHAVVQRIITTRLGAWLLARLMPHLDRWYFKLSGGRTTMASIFSGLPVMLLTTYGKKSGAASTVPLIYIRDPSNPNSLAVIASNWGQPRYPAWYWNLQANPRATCSLNNFRAEYIACEAQGAEYDRIWQSATETFYGYSIYKQRAGRRIPIMVLIRFRAIGKDFIDFRSLPSDATTTQRSH